MLIFIIIAWQKGYLIVATPILKIFDLAARPRDVDVVMCASSLFSSTLLACLNTVKMLSSYELR
jgi:hypothetical protein